MSFGWALAESAGVLFAEKPRGEWGHGHVTAQYPREDEYTEEETRDVVPFEPPFLIRRAEKAFPAGEPVGTYAENESGKTHEHSELTCPVHELCP